MYIQGTSRFGKFNVLAIISIAILVQSQAVGATAARNFKLTQSIKKFDGYWWRGADQSERTGFLYALDDCLTFDRTPRLTFTGTWSHYDDSITKYYRMNPLKRFMLVQVLFEHFGMTATLSPASGVTDRYGDEFWRSHNERGRVGFIEGYTSCKAGDRVGLSWPRPSSYYVQQLDKLYNADDRFGENAPEYAGSIASALEKVH